jgi:hypothetical protein
MSVADLRRSRQVEIQARLLDPAIARDANARRLAKAKVKRSEP